MASGIRELCDELEDGFVRNYTDGIVINPHKAIFAIYILISLCCIYFSIV